MFASPFQIDLFNEHATCVDAEFGGRSSDVLIEDVGERVLDYWF